MNPTTHSSTTYGWSWTSDHFLASGIAGLTRVPVPGGGTLLVHALEPQSVLAVHAPTPAALAGVREVLGADWVQDLLTVVGTAGSTSDPACRPGSLDARWQRIVVIYTVRQWFPWTVAGTVLDADEALAWDRLGVRSWAQSSTELAQHAISGLAAALLSGRLPTQAHADVEAATALLDGYLDDDSATAAGVRELHERVADASTLDDAEVEGLLRDWAAARREPAELALSMGAEPSRADATPRLILDPRCLSTGVIAWDSPGQPAITVATTTDAVSIAITLQDGREADDAEPASLTVYAADSATGTILASAQVTPAGPDSFGREMLAAELTRPAGPFFIGVCDAHHLSNAPTTLAEAELADAASQAVLLWASVRVSVARGMPMAQVRADHQGALEWLEQACENARAHTGQEQAFALAAVARRYLLDLTSTDRGTSGDPLRPLLAEILSADVLDALPHPDDVALGDDWIE